MGIFDRFRRKPPGGEQPAPEPETYTIGGVTFTLVDEGHRGIDLLYDPDNIKTARVVNTFLDRLLQRQNYTTSGGVMKKNGIIDYGTANAIDFGAANPKKQLTVDAVRDGLKRLARAYPTAEELDAKVREGQLGKGARQLGQQTALATRDTQLYLDAVVATLVAEKIPVNQDLRFKLQEALVTAHMERGA